MAAAVPAPPPGILARTPAPAVAPLICVVDGGVRRVGVLASRLVSSDVLPGVGGGPEVADDHATFVADAAVATWPWARIASVRIVDGGSADGSLVPGAIDRCVALGASVVNISLVGPQPGWLLEQTREAMVRARAADVDVVVAAGNDGGPVSFPANAAPDVAIAVDATDGTTRCPFSSTGPEVVVGAPGCPALLPALDGAGVSPVRGSSFAAPQVAAALAAIRAYAPGSTPASRRAVLTGMPNGSLDQGELLRRIGRADLLQAAPVPAQAVAATPSRPATPELRVRWRSRRLVLAVTGAPSRARLVVRRAGVRSATAPARLERWNVPRRLTRSAGRLSLVVEDAAGGRLTRRTVRVPG